MRKFQKSALTTLSTAVSSSKHRIDFCASKLLQQRHLKQQTTIVKLIKITGSCSQSPKLSSLSSSSTTAASPMELVDVDVAVEVLTVDVLHVVVVVVAVEAVVEFINDAPCDAQRRTKTMDT